MVEDIDGPRVDASEADEQMDGAGCRGGRVLFAEDDGVCAELKPELGEWGGREDVWYGRVDLDGLGAGDEGVVECEMDGLYAVVGLGGSCEGDGKGV